MAYPRRGKYLILKKNLDYTTFYNAGVHATLSNMRNVSEVMDRERFTKNVSITSGEFIKTDPVSVTALDDACFNYNFSLPHRHNLIVLLPTVIVKKLNEYAFVHRKQYRTLLV